MLEIDTIEISTKILHGYLLGPVGPRPIALVSSEHVRNSSILSGNDLAKLANIESLPTLKEVAKSKKNNDIAKILNTTSNNLETRAKFDHHYNSLLLENKLLDARDTLLIEN